MKQFRFLDDIATADTAFEASAETIEELFTAASEAVLAVMTVNPGDVRPKTQLSVSLESSTLEMLLFSFLGEQIFYKDSESLLLLASDLHITEHEDLYSLTGTLSGEAIDRDRHDMIVDVKAVTLYRLRVVREDNLWKATVVLDI